MTEAELKRRFKAVAIRVVHLGDALPRRRSSDVISRQLIRAGTSSFANYRAACRAKSAADFVSKLAIVEEELDESSAWLELLSESEIVKPARLTPLRTEIDELTAIIVASIRTARNRVQRGRRESIQNPKSKIQNTPGAA